MPHSRRKHGNKIMRYLIHAYNASVPNSSAKPFFIVPARNQQSLEEKIMELEDMQVPYIIVCGEKMNHPRVVYREAGVNGTP